MAKIKEKSEKLKSYQQVIHKLWITFLTWGQNKPNDKILSKKK